MGSTVRTALVVVVALVGSVLLPATARATATCPTVSTTDFSLSPAPAGAMQWAGCDLADAVAVSSNLAGADLSGANLTGINLANSDLTGANLTGANLTEADLTGATVTGVIGTGAIWTDARCPDGRYYLQHVAGVCLNGVDHPLDIRLLPLAGIQTTPSIAIRWQVTGQASQIATVWIWVAHSPDTLGPRPLPGLWRSAVHNGSAVYPATPGTVACVSVEALASTQSSVESHQACTVMPWATRQMTASRGWSKGVGSAWLGGSYRFTTTSGRSLSTPIVSARQVGVVATTCPSCGRVALYVGATKVGTISLRSSRTTMRAPLTLRRLTRTLHGRLRLVTVGSGRLVRVDGLIVGM